MSEYPQGLREFLKDAGWEGAKIEPLPGDASFRRYFRIIRNLDRAMLMYAPPPYEDPGPFIKVARYLSDQGLRAPKIHAARPDEGWVLIEDFGDHDVRKWLDSHPDHEGATYETAIETLVELHGQPAGDFPTYDLPTYHREADLFIEWYCPAMQLAVDSHSWTAAWDEVLSPLMARQHPGVTVLRDYHAENIMLPSPGAADSGEQGLIDFQDALIGHPAYDVVSLLQDARRDVAPDLEHDMLDYYIDLAAPGPEFVADYARLGAQRNAKIVGIFTRLWKRDAKPRYLDLIPRVWDLLERDLAHPALGPVAQWFDANIPRELREAKGGDPK